MISRYEQLQFVESLGLTVGQSRRVKCPFCNSTTETFAVSRLAGKFLWHCFRSRCNVAGVQTQDLSAQEIRRLLALEDKYEKLKEWAVPEHFVNPMALMGTACEQVFDFLERTNCNFAYLNSLIEIEYDPKYDRVVFLNGHNGKTYGAIGRALELYNIPKWLKYPESASLPYIVNAGSNLGVIVEDVPSACAVSAAGLGGIALCGTTFQDEYLTPILQNFSKVIVALDNDASDKALKLHKHISQYVDADVVLLKRDLKEFGAEDIVNILGLLK